MISVPKITLNNGVGIPAIGYGCHVISRPIRLNQLKSGFTKPFRYIQSNINYKINTEPKFVRAVSNAIVNGFTLIDYSPVYGSESLIGKAVKQSGIKREQLFLTTRVTNRQQMIGNIREELFRTLENYQTNYVDLYMFHWPVTDVYIDTWKQMEQLYKEGYCKAIGVANCHQHHLEALLKTADIVPQVNQFEIHPLFTQKNLIAFCKSKEIMVEAYTPIARFDDRLVHLPKLHAIAGNHNKSIIQVVLRWHIQNGAVPIIRSLNAKRQQENISVFDFELTSEEIKIIDSFNINSRLRFDPDNCDFSIL